MQVSIFITLSRKFGQIQLAHVRQVKYFVFKLAGKGAWIEIEIEIDITSEYSSF